MNFRKPDQKKVLMVGFLLVALIAGGLTGVIVCKNYSILVKAVKKTVEPCPWSEPELDLSVDKNNPYLSPENVAFERRMAGEPPQNFTYENLGRDPQFILGYPEKMSYGTDQDIVIRYGKGIWGEGAFLTQAVIVDAVTNKILHTIQFPEAEKRLELEKCVAYYKGGCQFLHTVSLPKNKLTAGSYYIFLTDDKGADSHPIFVNVRPSLKEIKDYDVLLIYPEFTWQAYNRFGGGSLYSIFRPDGQGGVEAFYYSKTRLYSASLQRPLLIDPSGERVRWHYQAALDYFKKSDEKRYDTALNIKKVAISKSNYIVGRIQNRPVTKGAFWTQRLDENPHIVLPFYKLLKGQGHKVATIMQIDIHDYPDILKNAKLVVFGGHHEYWSEEEEQAIQTYLKKGGKIANFSGNTFWGQINVENENIYLDQESSVRPLSCYKKIPDEFDDTGFLGYRILPGAQALIGLSYRFGGYPVFEYNFSAEDKEKFGVTDALIEKSSGIYINRPDHPVFKGMNLEKGQRVGARTHILSLEIDGLPMTPEGQIDRRFSHYMPSDANIQILAQAHSFAANRIWGKDEHSNEEYYGLEYPAVFVDYQPYGADAGRIVSFGSIGYGIELAQYNKQAEQIFLNSVSYLLED